MDFTTFKMFSLTPDIRELSGPDKKSLISVFGLFCLGNTGSNLGPEKKSLLYPSHVVLLNLSRSAKCLLSSFIKKNFV